jgi:hypothetical protein
MNHQYTKLINRPLDKLVRPEVHLFHQIRSAYLVCGYVGLLLTILLSMFLVSFTGLSCWVMVAIVLATVLTSLGLAMATKIITGRENIIYYHHEIAAISVTTMLLWLLRQPALPYLDVTILGIGVLLIFGRIGCLMVGCCHGRPHSWGVCYRTEHAAAGFTPYFVGVRLFPVQALESLWVLVTVLVGSTFILNGLPQGEATSWYLIFYGTGRFCFEFLRGDPERPYYKGFSQPQWISALLMCFAVAFELSGGLPFHVWHAIAVVIILSIMMTIALMQRFQINTKYQLLCAQHIREVAEEIFPVINQPTDILIENFIPKKMHVGCTSLGIRISVGKIEYETYDIEHYTLSLRNGKMNQGTARILIKLIIQLRHSTNQYEIIQGNQGIYHLLIHS